MVFNSNDILKILPHRYPFVLIDRVLEMDGDKHIKALKNVSINEAFFQGHFPTEHVMPGVLIVEAMAQTGAVLLLNQEGKKGQIAYFAGIKNCKFRRKVIPGDQLIFEVKLIRSRENYGVASAIATVDGEVACEAEISFMISSN